MAESQRRYTPSREQKNRVLAAGETATTYHNKYDPEPWMHDLQANILAGMANNILQVPTAAAPIVNAVNATYNYATSTDPKARWRDEYNKSTYGTEGIRKLNDYENTEYQKLLSGMSAKDQADPEVQKSTHAAVQGSQGYHDLSMAQGRGVTGAINRYSDTAQNLVNNTLDLPPVNQQGTVGELEQIIGGSILPSGWFGDAVKGGNLATRGALRLGEWLLPGSHSVPNAVVNTGVQEGFSQLMRGMTDSPSVFTGDEGLAETGKVHPGISDMFSGPATSSNTPAPQRRVGVQPTSEEDASASSPFSLVSSAAAAEMPQPTAWTLPWEPPANQQQQPVQQALPLTTSRRDGTPINPAVDKDGGGDAALWGGIVAVGAGIALVAASLRGKVPVGQLGRVIEDVDSPSAAIRMTPTPADQLKAGTIGTGPDKVKNTKDVAQTAVDKTAPPRIVARDAMTAANDPDLQMKMDKLNREQHVASRLEVANAAKRSYVNGEVPLLGRRTIPTNEIRKMRDGLDPAEQDLVQKGVIYGTRMDDYKRVLNTISDEINAGYIKLRTMGGQIAKQKLLMDIRDKETRLRALNDPNAPFEGNMSVRDVNAIVAQAQANPHVRTIMDGMKKVRDDFNESRKIDGAVTQDYINGIQRDTPNFLPISKDPLSKANTWEKVKYGFRGRAEAEEVGKSSVGPVNVMYSGKRGPIEANPSIKQAPTAEMNDVIDSLDEHIYEIHRQMRKSRAAKTFTEIVHGTPEWGNSVRVAHDPIPVKDFERMSTNNRKLEQIIADPRAYLYHDGGNIHIMHAADPEVARAMRNNPSSTMAIADQLRRGMEATYTGKKLAPWFSIKSAWNELGIARVTLDRQKYDIGFMDQMMKGVFPNIAGLDKLFQVVPDPTFVIKMLGGIHEQAIGRSINYVSELLGNKMSQQSTLIAGMGPEHARAIADTGIRAINDIRYRIAFFKEHGIIDTPTVVKHNEGVFDQWKSVRQALDVIPGGVKLPFRVVFDAYMGLNDIVRTSVKYPIASNALDKLLRKHNGNIPHDEMRQYIQDMKYIGGDMSRAVGSPALANLNSAAPFGLNSVNSGLHMIESAAENKTAVLSRVLGNMVLPKVFWTMALTAWIGPKFVNAYWGDMPTWQRQSVVPTISPSYLLEIATGKYRPPTMHDVVMMHQAPEAIPIAETMMSMLQAAGFFNIGGLDGRQQPDLNKQGAKNIRPSDTATWWDVMHGVGSMLSVNVPIVSGLDILLNGDNKQMQSTGLSQESEGSRRVIDMIGSIFGGATEVVGNGLRASTDSWYRGRGVVDALEKGLGYAVETAKQKMPETPMSPLFGGQRRHYTKGQMRERNSAKFDAIKKVSDQLMSQKRDVREGGYDAYATHDPEARNMMQEMHSSADSGPMLHLKDQRSKLYRQLDHMDQNRGQIKPSEYTSASEKIKADINAIDHQEEEIFNRLDVRLATRYHKLGVTDVESAIKYISGTIQP